MLRPWAAALLLVAAVGGASAQACPPRCLCFRTTVRCMFLQLETVPPIPKEATVVDLRFNKIREIPTDAFKNVKNLNTLLLNNNHIWRLQNGVFEGLSKLRYLYLYKNRLREIEPRVFQGLRSLEQLYLHFNDLVAIDADTFSNLPKLERLYLHFNKIEKLEPGVFSDLRSLERLFLHNNRIQRIPAGAFKNLGALKRLRLDSNALVCDCSLLWLAQMLRGLLNSTHAAATCQFPTRMQGRQLADMSMTDLHCEKPRITEDPHDVEVSFGGTVFFTCKAEGDPQPEIVWMKDSNEVNLDEPRYSKLSDGTLMIENAGHGDMGVYECMAKSPAGEARSRAARMLHDPANSKPYFRRTPVDQTTQVGGTVTLYCAAAGHPAPEVSWTRDDIPITASDRFQLENDGTLTVTNIQREDGGSYKCSASNYVGRVSSVAEIKVNETVSHPKVAPTFTTRPDNLTIKSGAHAEFRCAADGSPVYTWYRDGRGLSPGNRVAIFSGGQVLRVEHAKESDSGVYVCRAQNEAGSSESAARLTVTPYSYLPGTPPPQPAGPTAAPGSTSGPGDAPRLLVAPYDMEAATGGTLELPCRAQGRPRPVISWTKDGRPIPQLPKYRVSPFGSLYVYNLSQSDAGVYQCRADNLHGHIEAHGRLTIKGSIGPGDRFVRVAFREASAAVDRAVNDTLTRLLTPTPGKSAPPHELFRLLRFPDATARSVARAAEVYETTLVNIRKHVEAGMKINLTTDFSYKELLSPGQLELIANLSGCMAHRPVVNCSDMCFHSKYRSIDGTCNNLEHPMWGASLTAFRRLLHPIYENGFSTPVGWKKTTLYNGFPKPSARLVSTKLISTDTITPDERLTHMLMQWGQFLDHDLDHAIPAVSSESWDGIDCKRSCDFAPPCFPMEVPPDDPRIRNRRCIDFVRSSAICGSGQTSVFFDSVMPREQINQLTSYIDASQVYGFSEAVARDLRDFLRGNFGLLREGVKLPNRKPLLPLADRQPNDCRRDLSESDIGCFIAGDIRSNEQLGLLAMHTLWFREHNRIATHLRQLNPHWDGDTIYHEARKIVGAEMQHITFKHWLPHILGAQGMAMLGEYRGYDPNLEATISNVFATAALRFGHSLINPVLYRLNASFQPIPEGHVPLSKAFFAPWRLVEEGGVDPLMRGLFFVPAKLKVPGQTLNTELTEHLFEVAHAVALDLAAMNVQRSRDHGIPHYNSWRRLCNLSEAHSFDDLRHEISSQAVRDQLQRIYGHPGNIDVWVGGILEDLAEGAKVGPTFRCLLVEQFRRLRDGDRFYYENPGVFKPEQLTQIRQASLARVLCDNGDAIEDVTRDLFVLPDRQGGLIKCNKLPSVQLLAWSDCCPECHERSNTISRRFRRSAEHSYPEDRPVSSTTPPPPSSQSETDSMWVNASMGATSATPTTAAVTAATITDVSYRDNQIEVDAEEVGEERLEGIESALEEFQRTIKQLRRKLRKLEHHCQAAGGGGGGGGGKRAGSAKCVDNDGRWRKNKELWKRDACTDCVCKEHQITCTTIKCAPPACAAPVHHEGECCPTCA